MSLIFCDKLLERNNIVVKLEPCNFSTTEGHFHVQKLLQLKFQMGVNPYKKAVKLLSKTAIIKMNWRRKRGECGWDLFFTLLSLMVQIFS